jgi:hypothetical protein
VTNSVELERDLKLRLVTRTPTGACQSRWSRSVTASVTPGAGCCCRACQRAKVTVSASLLRVTNHRQSPLSYRLRRTFSPSQPVGDSVSERDAALRRLGQSPPPGESRSAIMIPIVIARAALAAAAAVLAMYPCTVPEGRCSDPVTWYVPPMMTRDRQ